MPEERTLAAPGDNFQYRFLQIRISFSYAWTRYNLPHPSAASPRRWGHAFLPQLFERLRDAHGANIFPGFITQFGSNTAFTCRIKAISRGLRE